MIKFITESVQYVDVDTGIHYQKNSDGTFSEIKKDKPSSKNGSVSEIRSKIDRMHATGEDPTRTTADKKAIEKTKKENSLSANKKAFALYKNTPPSEPGAKAFMKSILDFIRDLGKNRLKTMQDSGIQDPDYTWQSSAEWTDEPEQRRLPSKIPIVDRPTVFVFFDTSGSIWSYWNEMCTVVSALVKIAEKGLLKDVVIYYFDTGVSTSQEDKGNNVPKHSSGHWPGADSGTPDVFYTIQALKPDNVIIIQDEDSDSLWPDADSFIPTFSDGKTWVPSTKKYWRDHPITINGSLWLVSPTGFSKIFEECIKPKKALHKFSFDYKDDLAK